MDWQLIGSALVSGGGVAWLLRLIMKNTVQQITKIPEEINTMKLEIEKHLGKLRTDIAALSIKLEDLKETQALVLMHDRQIATLEALGGRKRSASNGRDTGS